MCRGLPESPSRQVASAKHAMQWTTSLEQHVYPVFGDLPVDTVDDGLVLRALEALWHDTPETASRVRGRIEMVLDWAKSRGHRRTCCRPSASYRPSSTMPRCRIARSVPL
jgi:integrase